MKIYTKDNKVFIKNNRIITTVKEEPIPVGAYKYFKLEVGTGSSSKLIISEFRLTTESGVDKTTFNCLAGTPTDSNYENGFDGKSSTLLSSSTGGAKIIFTKNEYIKVTKYGFLTPSMQALLKFNSPYSWGLFGSNTETTDFDDSSWQLIDEQIKNSKVQNTTTGQTWVEFEVGE